MRTALITPLGPRGNPGSVFITAGIQFLFEKLGYGPFVQVDMLKDRPDQWEAAKECGLAILCGNPRFSIGNPGDIFWWETGIWERLLELQRSGVRVIDGWAGACHPDMSEYLDYQADDLYGILKNKYSLECARSLSGHITRDRLAELVYSRRGIPARFLPCSSAFAATAFGVVPAEKSRTALILPPYGNEAHVHDVQTILEVNPGMQAVAVTWLDCAWFKEAGIPACLVNDPKSILEFLAGCECVISYRLHAAIPAASLGARVVCMAMDSRPLACEPFGIPIVWHVNPPHAELATIAVRGVKPELESILADLKTA